MHKDNKKAGKTIAAVPRKWFPEKNRRAHNSAELSMHLVYDFQLARARAPRPGDLNFQRGSATRARAQVLIDNFTETSATITPARKNRYARACNIHTPAGARLLFQFENNEFSSATALFHPVLDYNTHTRPSLAALSCAYRT